MQKLFLILLSIIFSTLVFSQNKEKFQYNLKEGDEYIANTNYISSSEIEVNGETQIVKKEEGFNYNIKVLHYKTDSSFYIKLTCTKIRKVFYIDDETIVLDSDSIENANILQTDSTFINVGKGFNFEISRHGNVILIDSVTASHIANNSNKEIIKNMFLHFPTNSFSINNSWNENDTIKGDIFNIYNRKHIFTEIKDGTYIIDNIAKISSDKTSYKKAKDLFIFYNMIGTEKGITVLDKNSCMIKEINNTQISEGKSEVRYSKDSGAIFSSPVKIENVFSVKIIKTTNNED